MRVNAATIKRLEEEHATLIEECKTIKSDINKILVGYCNDWLADTEGLRKQLKDEAKTYTEQRQLLTNCQAEQEKATTLINTLTQYRQNILLACPDWQVAEQAQAYPCRDINAEWTALMGKVTTFTNQRLQTDDRCFHRGIDSLLSGDWKDRKRVALTD